MSEEEKQPEIQEEMQEIQQDAVEQPEKQEEAAPAPDEVRTQHEEKPKKSMEERLAEIKKATWEKHEAQRQLDARMQDIQEREKKILEQQQQGLKEPNIDDYDDTDKYKQDISAYAQQKANIEAQKIASDKLKQQTYEQKQNEVLSKWNLKKEMAIEKNPQFREHEYKVESILRTYGTHPVIEQTLIESDMSTDIVTYLAKNPDDMERLAQSSPGLAIKTIGRLEAKLEKPKKTTQQAPPPPTGGMGNAGSASTDTSKMSMEEYKAYMNKQEFGQ